MTETKPHLHLGGMPTGPQVRKIEQAFPDIESLRGSVIPHERIERLIGEKRESNRYRTVTGSWRKKVERNIGVVIDGRGSQGQGFRVLTHDEQVDFGVKQRRSGARRIRRAYTVVGSTDEKLLTAERRKVREFELTAAAKINAAALNARRIGPPPLNTGSEDAA